MHISLTPELEDIVLGKVASGLYNNASEVIREALRLMRKADQLSNLRQAVAVGAEQAERGDLSELSVTQIARRAKSRARQRSS